MIDDLIMLRAAERILAILIGGLAIWCGFRLFLAIPDQPADSRVEVSLAKSRRLLISRIGPGTFFALFGTALVLASFYFSINLKTQAGDRYSGLGQRASQTSSMTAAAPPTVASVPALDAAQLRLSLAFLSDLEAELAVNSTEDDKSWRARRFQMTKLAILGRGWEPGWGDFAEFELWLNEGPARASRPEFERALAVMEGRE
jgi:hypothetical protein